MKRDSSMIRGVTAPAPGARWPNTHSITNSDPGSLEGFDPYSTSLWTSDSVCSHMTYTDAPLVYSYVYRMNR